MTRPALSEFADDPIMQQLVADELGRTYHDSGYFSPAVADVIAEVLDTVRADIRDRAEDQSMCNKVDDCAAKAIVLHRLADWLEGAP